MNHRHVIANDLSPDAIVAMRRNVDINGLAPRSNSQSTTDQPGLMKDLSHSASPSPEPRGPTVTVNEGDAMWAACC